MTTEMEPEGRPQTPTSRSDPQDASPHEARHRPRQALFIVLGILLSVVIQGTVARGITVGDWQMTSTTEWLIQQVWDGPTPGWLTALRAWIHAPQRVHLLEVAAVTAGVLFHSGLRPTPRPGGNNGAETACLLLLLATEGLGPAHACALTGAAIGVGLIVVLFDGNARSQDSLLFSTGLVLQMNIRAVWFVVFAVEYYVFWLLTQAYWPPGERI